MKPAALRHLLTALSIAVASPAAAEPVLDLVLDGEAHAFTPVTDGARTGFTRFLSVDAVSIEGADGPARLVLEIALPPGSSTGDAPHDARIVYRPDGFRDYWVSPAPLPEGAIAIEHLDLASATPRIAGRFEAPLCFTASPLHRPDPAHCIAAAGRFDTPLVRD